MLEDITPALFSSTNPRQRNHSMHVLPLLLVALIASVAAQTPIAENALQGVCAEGNQIQTLSVSANTNAVDDWGSGSTACYANLITGVAEIISFSYNISADSGSIPLSHVTADIFDITTNFTIVDSVDISSLLPTTGGFVRAVFNNSVQLDPSRMYLLGFSVRQDSTGDLSYTFVAGPGNFTYRYCNDWPEACTSDSAWFENTYTSAAMDTVVEYRRDCSTPSPSLSPSPSPSTTPGSSSNEAFRMQGFLFASFLSFLGHVLY